MTEICAVSGGLPFRILEAARAAEGGSGDLAVSGLGDPAVAVLRRVALLGSAFTTDELLAVSGVGEDEAYAALAAGLDGVGGGARGDRVPVPARLGPGRGAGDLPAARAVPRRRRGRRPDGRAGRARHPCRPPLHRLRSPGAGDPARAAGGRDGGRAGRVPRRPGPRGCGDRPRLRQGPGAPAGPAWRPAAGAGRPGRGGGVPRRPVVDHRHRAPPGPGAAGPRGHVPGRPGHRHLGAGRTGARRRRRRRAAAAGPGQPGVLPGRHRRGVRRRRRGADGAPARRPVADRRPGRAAGADRAPAGRVVRAVPARAAAHPGRPEHGDRGVRRAPVRGRVPALRPGPLPRGDHPRRAAAAPGRAPRGAPRGGVRDLPDRRGSPADGRPRPRRARADRGRRAARRRGRPGRPGALVPTPGRGATWPAATVRGLASFSRRRCRWPAGQSSAST